MNARDLNKQKSASDKVSPQNLLRPTKASTSLWDKLSDLSLDTFADRIKFLIVFILIGLFTILAGDVLKLIPLKGTGIAFQILGWLLISVGFLGPFVKFMDEHS